MANQISKYEQDLMDKAIKDLSNLVQSAYIKPDQINSLLVGIRAINRCEENNISLLDNVPGCLC